MPELPRVSFPPDGPQSEVWNYLYSGVDRAVMELHVLEEETSDAVQEVAKRIARDALELFHDPERAEQLIADDALLGNPWIRHAVEVEFAWQVVDRGCGVLDRYRTLSRTLTEYQLVGKPAQYVSEVVWTYLYGFDPACIALCGAALEQMLKDVLIRRGDLTESQVARAKLPAGKLLSKACDLGLILQTRAAAKRVLDERNRVMHTHIWEDRVLQEMARQTIAGLCAVADELGTTSPASSD